MNKQQLANKIWESANKMRSKIEANEYKDYILGFIFYRYLSEQEEKFLREEYQWEDEDINDPEAYEEEETILGLQSNLGYCIKHKDLFSTWLTKGADFTVGDVREALGAFNRSINKSQKSVFEGIFNTLETGLSKLGENTNAQTKAIRDLIRLIRDIPMDGKQDYDVLGFIYEYLIEKFAANAGKKAGEFYTPHEVSVLMSEIIADYLKDKEEIKIFDPTSGSGSLLINIGKSVAKRIGDKDKIQYYAQELKQNTYNLTRMNLVMRGINASNIITRNADTLEEDWPFFDEKTEYDPLYVDAVVSNPPYSQNWEPAGKEQDPRYREFGIAPKSKADYAFLLHDLFHIKPDGIMTIVLPHGVLFRGGEEGTIRERLIEKGYIDAVIGLPSNIFYGTGIPTIIMVLKKNRPSSDVLIIDASKGFVKEGKNNKLRASDIKRIADAVISRKDIPGFSRNVSKQEIVANDYNLNIPRYVESTEKVESFDIYASMFGGIPKQELDELKVYWEAFPTLRNALFDESGDAAKLKVENIKEFINNYEEVSSFRDKFDKAFSEFPKMLKEKLITNAESVNIVSEENDIADTIFNILNDSKLIDEYEAYQILDDEWNSVSADLEIIQTEGMESTKKVDPNMILKKKNKTEVEVQDGWVGRIFSFELVQNSLLGEEAARIKAKEDRVAEISSAKDEIFESLTEEDKSDLDDAVIKEDGSAFENKEVTKLAKQLRKEKTIFDEDSLEARIIKFDDLLSEEKALNKEVKKDKAALEDATKTRIENLSDEEVEELLVEKWIRPLEASLKELPKNVIKNLIDQITNITDKYADTLANIETEIKETEQSLVSMLKNLTGNDSDMKGISELQALLMGE